MRQKISKFRGKTIISQDNLIHGVIAMLISTILLYHLYLASFRDFELLTSFILLFLFGLYFLKKTELVIDSNKGTLSYENQNFNIDEINLFKITHLDKLEPKTVPKFFFEQTILYQIILVTKDSNLFEIFEQSNNLEDLNKILEILETEGFKVINSEFKILRIY